MKTLLTHLSLVPAGCLAVAMLSSCSTIPSGTTPGSSGQATQPTAAKPDLANEVKQAKELISLKKYREAEALLTRAVSGADYNFEAWQSFLQVHDALAEQYGSAGWNDFKTNKDEATIEFKTAGNHLDMALLSLTKIRGLATQPSIKIDPENMVVAENNYAATKHHVHLEIGCFCEFQLMDADSWAWIAIDYRIHWNGPDNRPEIVRGLKALKPVMTLKAWASEENRTELRRLYLKFKGAVKPDEWTGLLAQAGIADVLELELGNNDKPKPSETVSSQ